MHLWWFCLWLWEWCWQKAGVFPWLELNQGFMSVAALIVALGLAILEQRRAVRAEAQMKASDAAADRRALEASNDADRRMREAAADADRKALAVARAADRKAAAAAAEAKRAVQRQFIDAVCGLLDKVIAAGERDYVAILALKTPEDRNVNLPKEMRDAAQTITSALKALQPAAPPIPDIILATEKVIREFWGPSHLDGYGVPRNVEGQTLQYLNGLKAAKREMLALRPTTRK